MKASTRRQESVDPVNVARKRDVLVDTMLSVLWPGVAQLRLGTYRKAALFAVLGQACIVVLSVHLTAPLQVFWLLPAAFGVLVVASAVDAHRMPPSAKKRSHAALVALFAISQWALFMLALAFAAPLSVYRVDGSSMHPTLQQDEVLGADRRYPWSAPLRRGQVIVYRESRRGDLAVKRVLALGGDDVLRCGERAIRWSSIRAPEGCRVSRLGAGLVFVLGDNERVSRDSRSHGPVAADTVEAVGRFIVYSEDSARTGRVLRSQSETNASNLGALVPRRP